MSLNKNIIPAIEEGLHDVNLRDVAIDYLELLIDENTGGKMLEEIPVVKTLLAFYSIGKSIKNRQNVLKVLVFLQQFHSSNLVQSEIDAFQEKLNSDVHFKNEVLSTIALLNERFISLDKSKILGHLFGAHLKLKITWKEFNDLGAIVDNMHPDCGIFLKNLFVKAPNLSYTRKTHRIPEQEETLLLSAGIASKSGMEFKLTKLGQQLFEHGVRPLFNEELSKLGTSWKIES